MKEVIATGQITISKVYDGEPGADGRELFTWIKYADTPTSGMSDDPQGKEYLGLAHNKDTPDESTDYADYEWSKIKGEPGEPGVPGPPGKDGSPLYTWVKYAIDDSGSGMSDYPDGKTYIGLAFNKTTPTESTNAADYQWSLIQGERGSQGVPGAPGANGQPTYVWVKYADTPTSGMSDSPEGKAYLGLAYNKTTDTESLVYKDYQWSKIKGEQGVPGVPGEPGEDGKSLYTWVRYATDSTGADMSDFPDGKTYIGLAYNKETPTESNDPTQYEWSLIQGPQGDQGIPGPAGSDGRPTYTWIKYADTPTSGMSDSPEGKAYLGLAYNKSTATESTSYSDYEWTKVKGESGEQGPAGGHNLLENGHFEDDAINSIPKWFNYSPNLYVKDISAMNANNGSNKALALKGNDSAATEAHATTLIPVTPGQTFYVEAVARYLNTVGNGYGRIGFRRYSADKKTSPGWNEVVNWTSKSTVFTKRSGVFTVPSDCYYIQFWVNFAATGGGNEFILDHIVINRAVNEDLLVNGVVKASHIQSLWGLTVRDSSNVERFKVDTSGNVTFGGVLSGATGTFSGTLSAASGSFKGRVESSTYRPSTTQTFRVTILDGAVQFYYHDVNYEVGGSTNAVVGFNNGGQFSLNSDTSIGIYGAMAQVGSDLLVTGAVSASSFTYPFVISEYNYNRLEITSDYQGGDVVISSYYYPVNSQSTAGLLFRTGTVPRLHISDTGYFTIRAQSWIAHVSSPEVAKLNSISGSGSYIQLQKSGGNIAKIGHTGSDGNFYINNEGSASGRIFLYPLNGSTNFEFFNLGTMAAMRFSGRTILKSLASDDGLHVRNYADNRYTTISASAFTVNSKREIKTNIQEVMISGLDVIKQANVYSYHLKAELEERDKEGLLLYKKNEEDVPKQIGLLWDEVPHYLRQGDGIDTYRTIALLWKAIQELSEKVEFLSNRH